MFSPCRVAPDRCFRLLACLFGPKPACLVDVSHGAWSWMPSLPRPVSRLFTWAGSAKAVAATVLFLAQYTIGSALPIMLVGEIQVPIILALLITRTGANGSCRLCVLLLLSCRSFPIRAYRVMPFIRMCQLCRCQKVDDAMCLFLLLGISSERKSEGCRVENMSTVLRSRKTCLTVLFSFPFISWLQYMCGGCLLMYLARHHNSASI